MLLLPLKLNLQHHCTLKLSIAPRMAILITAKNNYIRISVSTGKQDSTLRSNINFSNLITCNTLIY